MPNWCHNHLRILGPNADADELRAFMTTPDGQFDIEALTRIQETWDDSAITKWLFENNGIHIHEPDTQWSTAETASSLCNHYVNFTSGWNPPMRMVVALSRRFPTLSFELSFDRQIPGFRGYVVVQEGLWALKECEQYETLRNYSPPNSGSADSSVSSDMHCGGAENQHQSALAALAQKAAVEMSVPSEKRAAFVRDFKMAFNHAWDQLEADPDPDFQMA